MKLIKINTDCYIIVDDSEIKNGDWVLYKNSYIATVLGFPTDGGEGLKIQVVGDRGKIKTDFSSCKKITHSTLPLKFLNEVGFTTANLKPDWSNVIQLLLSEVKELIGEVDVEQKYNATWLRKYESYESKEGIAFKTGYNQALEDNKEKKYTEEDLLDAWELGASVGLPLTRNKKETLFKALQPKSEWEVKFDENGKLKLV